jgi:hypothetical protein
MWKVWRSSLGRFEPQLLIHRLPVMIDLLGANLVALYLKKARSRKGDLATRRRPAAG